MTRQQMTFLPALTACVALCGCMGSRDAGLRDIPESLEPAGKPVPAIASHGIGVQIYDCQASGTDPTLFAWMLKAPEAKLRYAGGGELGKHYAGPTWEANDGSKVVGDVVARDAGPDADAIPWLLLRAKVTSGRGVFSAVQSIQRLHTTGGKAPPTGCDRSHAGAEVRVPYSADYYFYTARP
jgi:hypothetical protein